MIRDALHTVLLGAILVVGLRPFSVAAAPPASDGTLVRVPSKDGTPIAVECAGSGPNLVIVHGGVGDHTRWMPVVSLLSSRFTVCAMDRRGHGVSGDSPHYGLAKEAEDVAAVVDSRPGPVFLLGHSYGGVAALEAAFLTTKIAKLILYEPPLQDRIDLAVAQRIEALIQEGQGEPAVETFLREVVRLPPSEVVAMRSRPNWPTLVAGVKSQPREMRALAAYRFDATRMSSLQIPTLLVTGAETTSPELKQAINSLNASLPQATLTVLAGQQHNAMDSGRPQLADAIVAFLAPPAAPPPPCAHAEMQRLAFLEGNWNVTGSWLGPEGRMDPVVGESEFASDLGGCLITERFRGTMKGKPFAALTLFAWDAGQKRFQMVHADSLHGSLVAFAGSPAEDGLGFEAEIHLSRTIALRQEYGRSGSTFAVERKRRFDGGEAWTTVWKAIYQKRP